METARSDEGDRLFAIQGHSDDFYVGVTPDGRQVLMGVNGRNVVAYFFSPDGVLLGRETRPLVSEPQWPGDTGPYLTRDPDYLASEWRQVSQWQEDLGFRPETIHVRAFTGLDEDFIKVEAVPRYWLEVDPDECEKDREGRMRAIQEWETAGNFVLWWHEPFHMSKEGEVVSTWDRRRNRRSTAPVTEADGLKQPLYSKGGPHEARGRRLVRRPDAAHGHAATQTGLWPADPLAA